VVQKKVDYICRQLEQLNAIKDLPEADAQPEQVTNRATDVLTAIMTYLAIHIRHERFGVLGSLHSVCNTNWRS